MLYSPQLHAAGYIYNTAASDYTYPPGTGEVEIQFYVPSSDNYQFWMYTYVCVYLWCWVPQRNEFNFLQATSNSDNSFFLDVLPDTGTRFDTNSDSTWTWLSTSPISFSVGCHTILIKPREYLTRVDAVALVTTSSSDPSGSVMQQGTYCKQILLVPFSMFNWLPSTCCSCATNNTLFLRKCCINILSWYYIIRSELWHLCFGLDTVNFLSRPVWNSFVAVSYFCDMFKCNTA